MPRCAGPVGKRHDFVQAIARLIYSLDLPSVARKASSNKKQADLLRQLKCEYGQGFLFAQPLSADAAQTWIREKAGHLQLSAGASRERSCTSGSRTAVYETPPLGRT